MGVGVHILGSGSAGNCALVASTRTRVLLDLGFGCRETCRRLQAVGVRPEDVQAVFVSHEHADHVSGLRRFRRDHPVPAFMTGGTREALGKAAGVGPLEILRPGQAVSFQDLSILPLAVSHDAAEPVAFVVTAEGVRIALVTDLGELTPDLRAALRRIDCLVLEFNHDVEMLRVGPYPWSIKQRVMSARGHLSNTAAAEFLGRDYDGGAEYIVLAHISRVNNHPEIARLSAEQALGARPRRSLFGSRLILSSQERPAEAIRF